MNNAYKDFARLAYRRSIVAALQRYVSEFLPSEVPASRTLQCEEVLVNDRDIPEEAFMDTLEDLRAEEAMLLGQMAQFEFRRKDERRRSQQEDTKVLGKEAGAGEEEAGEDGGGEESDD